MGTGASRTRSSGIVFDAPEGEIDGGCSARSRSSILTGGGPLDVRDAVDRHFDETMQRRSVIRLHFVRDEVALA